MRTGLSLANSAMTAAASDCPSCLGDWFGMLPILQFVADAGRSLRERLSDRLMFVGVELARPLVHEKFLHFDGQRAHGSGKF